MLKHYSLPFNPRLFSGACMWWGSFPEAVLAQFKYSPSNYVSLPSVNPPCARNNATPSVAYVTAPSWRIRLGRPTRLQRRAAAISGGSQQQAGKALRFILCPPLQSFQFLSPIRPQVSGRLNPLSAVTRARSQPIPSLLPRTIQGDLWLATEPATPPCHWPSRLFGYKVDCDSRRYGAGAV